MKIEFIPKGTLFIDLCKIPVYSIMKLRRDGGVYEREYYLC